LLTGFVIIKNILFKWGFKIKLKDKIPKEPCQCFGENQINHMGVMMKMDFSACILDELKEREHGFLKVTLAVCSNTFL
jgi:hypothetical protein